VTELWILPIMDSPKPPPERITFSLPVVNAAKTKCFTAIGEGKVGMVDSCIRFLVFFFSSLKDFARVVNQGDVDGEKKMNLTRRLKWQLRSLRCAPLDLRFYSSVSFFCPGVTVTHFCLPSLAQSAGNDTFIPASLVTGNIVWLLDAAGASKLQK
jgi:hypothetical protein